MNNTEIKACPFCGNEAKLTEGPHGKRIYCRHDSTCLIRGQIVYDFNLTEWNRRAGDRTPTALETESVKALVSARGSASPSKKPVRKKGVLIPADNSFEAINRFVNCLPSPEYEELQWALLGLAASREKELKAK